ncbi:MAG: acetamidase/formamidase family protein [Thermomicrobiales bacterium]
MQRVRLEQFGYDLRTPDVPLLSVRSGETIVVETEDHRAGQVRTPEQATPDGLEQYRRDRDAGKLRSPLTGPIIVEGAEPGDVLAVTIEQIVPDSLGFASTWPFLQPDWFDEPVTRFTEIRDGRVHYDDRVTFPVRPMIGCLGCTPPPETGLFSIASPYGGNMDCPDVCPGNTLLLPVAVPGAAFYLGDAHAAQADGEFCGSGIEIRAEVALTLSVRKPKPPSMTWPRIETPDAIVVVAAAPHLEDALNLAVRDLCYWLRDDYGYTLTDAFMVATQVADGRACQVLPNTPGSHVMRVRMPRQYLQ